MFSIVNLHYNTDSKSKELYTMNNSALYAIMMSALTYLTFLIQIKLDDTADRIWMSSAAIRFLLFNQLCSVIFNYSVSK